ncbi:MAG TPA: hypothetical protein VKQ29_12470 [Aliidongia sp.]|nr:hypothetical protein [Aliidongia sp.]
MARLLLPLILAAALAAIAVVCATRGHAQSLVCRTVDGNTVCAGPGATSCQTVNGKTVCAQNGPSCRSGRGKAGCNDDPPATKPQDDMSTDDSDSDDDDGMIDPPHSPAVPSPSHRR